jgi:hypothetical protein
MSGNLGDQLNGRAVCVEKWIALGRTDQGLGTLWGSSISILMIVRG